jgi:hypothetical protein
MIDRNYFERRAAQETDLASAATSRQVAAAHEMMAAAYLRQVASEHHEEIGEGCSAELDLRSWRCNRMPMFRIFYFREGLLEDSEEGVSDDLVTLAKAASSKHPHLTAEIWWGGRKAAVVRPSWEHRVKM